MAMKKMKIFKSKKGIHMPDKADMIMGIIVGVIFFFVIFYMLSLTETAAQEEIAEKQSFIESHYALKNFLLMPITPDFSEGDAKNLAEEMNANNIRIVDLVKVMDDTPLTEQEELQKQVFEDQKNMLKETLPDGWLLEILRDGETGSQAPEGYLKADVTEILVPEKEPGKTITIRLLIGKIKIAP